MALAAITCMRGPPCRPGNTALSMAVACSDVDRMQPARGPRSVLWVVKVTTSDRGTGLGWTPPAISPAMWAASKMSSAPTSSAMARSGSGSMIRG